MKRMLIHIVLLLFFFMLVSPILSKASTFDSTYNETNIQYSTFLGGSESDFGESVTTDINGNIYTLSNSKSVDFPHISNNNSSSELNIFVTKFDIYGKLNFSVKVGLGKGTGISVDRNGFIFITGYANKFDFPPDRNEINRHNNPYNDIFVVKLDVNGNNIFSTIIGGNKEDISSNIAIDNNENIYITGYTNSTNFYSNNYYNYSNYDVFVININKTGDIKWCTIISGEGNEWAKDISINNDIIYITGGTDSEFFPVTNNSYDDSYNGDIDAFIIKLNIVGDTIYSTYFGGNNKEIGQGIVVDEFENIYITGGTNSSNLLNTSSSIFNTQIVNTGYNLMGFITKFNSDGKSILFSNYIGDKNRTYIKDIVVDSFGCTYITGETSEDLFKLNRDIHKSNELLNSEVRMFIMKFGINGEIIHCSYIGDLNSDIGLDESNSIALFFKENIVIFGSTSSSKFPVTYNAYDKSINGKYDATLVIMRIFDNINPIANIGNDITISEGTSLTIDSSNCTDNVGIINWTWEINQNNQVTNFYESIINYFFKSPSIYKITLTVYDSEDNCDFDTIIVTVKDIQPPNITLYPKIMFIQQNSNYSFGDKVNYNDNSKIVNWTWMIMHNLCKEIRYEKYINYSFNNSGSYNFTLIARDEEGNVGSDYSIIIVNDTTKPNAIIYYEKTRNDEYIIMSAFESTDDVGIVNWTWIINENDNEYKYYNITFIHEVINNGQYNITLIVKDFQGNEGITQIDIIINENEKESEYSTYFLLIVMIFIAIIILLSLILVYNRNNTDISESDIIINNNNNNNTE